MRFFFHLLRRHLLQYPGRALAALAVLTVASALMLALAGAGAALRFRLGGYLTQLFPEEQVWLEAGRTSLGPIALESRPITDQTVQSIGARPEVQKVWPVEPIRFPVYVTGNLFGQEISSDAVIHGVPRTLIADALGANQPWTKPANPDGPYPIVVSRYFLDLYNLGLARSSGMPLLSPNFVVGRHVTLVLGESSVTHIASDKPAREVKGVVAGFTAQPAMIGLAMPDEVVRAFNNEFSTHPAPVYVTLVVLLKKGADRPTFLRAANEEGLVLSGGNALGERIKNAVQAAGWSLIALAIAVFILGMLTFYMLFLMIFHARRLDLIRLRALGLSPVQAVGLALGEVGAIAATAVILAGGANVLLSAWAARSLSQTAEVMAWLPPHLFEPATGWLILASALILVTTLLPALPMLWWVIKVEPGQVIRDM